MFTLLMFSFGSRGTIYVVSIVLLSLIFKSKTLKNWRAVIGLLINRIWLLLSMQVWDIRTKANVHTLSGHTNTVATVRCQAAEPQVITGKHTYTHTHKVIHVAKTCCCWAAR